MESEFYLSLLRALISKTETYLNVDFENALPIALAVFREINKDRRVTEMLKRKQLITAKQLVFLQKRLGITVEPVISKEEASKLISEQLRNGNNRNNNYSNGRNYNNKGRLATALSY